ncbi:hypothetical protein HDU81_001568 [Chytriomyces hyalinus]|nr:hypothetical protein HDU81_001568 [Chytriomyces hyalinus]
MAKLRIHELRFPRSSTIPTQIRDMLHLVPMLTSLHLRTLEDFVGVALSEFKSLRKLSPSKLFVRAEEWPEALVRPEARVRPEALVGQLLDIVEATKIQQLEPLLPWGLHLPPSELKGLVTALFLQRGWCEQPGQNEKHQWAYHFVCRRRK